MGGCTFFHEKRTLCYINKYKQNLKLVYVECHKMSAVNLTF